MSLAYGQKWKEPSENPTSSYNNSRRDEQIYSGNGLQGNRNNHYLTIRLMI